jgi:ribosomal protein L37AE/L43A
VKEIWPDRKCEWCGTTYTPVRYLQRRCHDCGHQHASRFPAFRIVHMTPTPAKPWNWTFTWSYKNHEPETDWIFRPRANDGKGQVFPSWRVMEARKKLVELQPMNVWQLPGTQAKVLIKLCFRWLAQHKELQPVEEPKQQSTIKTSPAPHSKKQTSETITCPECGKGQLKRLYHDPDYYDWQCSTCAYRYRTDSLLRWHSDNIPPTLRARLIQSTYRINISQEESTS